MNRIINIGLSSLLAAVTLLGLITVQPAKPAHAMSGSGTAQDPYIISTLSDLELVENDLSSWYELSDDIDGEGANFSSIGYSHACTPFSGHFDGKGFTISNLVINRFQWTTEATKGAGLFAQVSGTVQDVNLDNITIDIDIDFDMLADTSGGITGSNSGSIYNCSVAGSTIKGYGSVGGIAGINSGTIEFCYTTDSTAIYNYADLGGFSMFAGGIVGYHTSGILRNCYSRSYVHGFVAGGVYGYAELESPSSIIDKCYSTGRVDSFFSETPLLSTEHPVSDYGESGSWTVVPSEPAVKWSSLVSNDGDTTYIKANSVNAVATFGFEIMPEEGSDFHSLKLSAVVRNESSGGSGFTFITIINDTMYYYPNTNYFPVSGTSYSTKTTSFSPWNINPVTNHPWTRDELMGVGENAVQAFGIYVTDNNPAQRITELYIDVMSFEALHESGFGWASIPVEMPTNCFWDTETSLCANSTGGGTGKTTTEMKTESTFTDAGWDFSEVWDINSAVNDGYPFLRDSGQEPDIVDFTLSSEYPEPDETITFDASGSHMAGEIVQYQWNFGDGHIFVTDSTNTTHSYDEAGDYEVSLNITDSSSNILSKTITLSVRNWSMAEMYAPVLYLHEIEEYFPQTIYSSLNNSDLRNGEILNKPITEFDLMTHNDNDYYLDMENASPYTPAPPEMFAGYPYTLYAREYFDDPDYYVFQYWYFLPYDKFINTHEGDWEMATVFINKITLEPVRLTTAHHVSRENTEWNDVTLIGGTHPAVYIALGSHSSWSTPGLHYFNLDTASENGLILYPEDSFSGNATYSTYKVMGSDTWLEWKGLWGEKGIILFNGPPSPGQQGNKWSNPVEWASLNNPSSFFAAIHSPVDLHAYDQYDNHSGLNEYGEIEAEIPGTYIFSPSDNESEYLIIYTEEDLRFEIEATDIGEFTFTVNHYVSSIDEEIVIAYENIAITENTTAVLQTGSTNPEYVMEIDLDGDGTTDQYKTPDQISGVNILPVADPGGPYTGTANTTVTFNGSGSYDPDGMIVSYDWDLDDDGEFDDASGMIVNYTWPQAYSGNISLMVTDNQSGTDIATTTVTITESSDCVVEFNFVDQSGNLSGTGDERIYIDNYGWAANGDQLTVDPETTLYYRAYYREGSGLYGPKYAQTCNASCIIDVPFRTVSTDFQDQFGQLSGTGVERVFVDHVGYLADNETVAVPLDSTVYHRAYFKEGSGLYGPKLSTGVNNGTTEISVLFRTVSTSFVDQFGDLTGTGEERVFIDHVGYLADNESVAVPLDSTVYHRAYFKEGSGLYGQKLSTTVGNMTAQITVPFRTISMDFQDQFGDLTGTGEERVFIDHIGYLADTESVAVPLDSIVYHRAYFKEGSGLYGPKLSTAAGNMTAQIAVPFYTVSMDFRDQFGDLAGTGEERVFIDHVGYLADTESVAVPLDSIVYHRAYFKEGSGLYGPKISTDIDSSTAQVPVLFNNVSMDFQDQFGDLTGTGEERVFIDHVGYLVDTDSVAVPLDSMLYYRAYFKEGSGLYGPKLSTAAGNTTGQITVPFHTISMDFQDQFGDLTGAGEERVFIDHIGYLADNETVAVPLDSTIYHRAYFKEGSGLYGPKLSTAVGSSTAQIVVQFRQITFSVIDSVSLEPVPGAQIYVDHVGYIENGTTVIVPIQSTVYHKAKTGDTVSEKTGVEVTVNWSRCIYQWDGTSFSLPAYE